MELKDVVICEALRTPIGRFQGGLSGVRPDDLAAHVIKAIVDRSGIDPALVDEVFMIPDELFGLFEKSLSDAAPATSRYKFRAGPSLPRLFGGYNLLMFGDLFQIPPNSFILSAVHPADG